MTGAVDPEPFDRMRGDVGTGGAERFTSNYLAALPDRLRCLRSSIEGGDLETAYDVAINLASSSEMVGAGGLATAARAVGAVAYRGQLPALRVLDELDELAAAVATGLVGMLGSDRPG